MKRKIIFEEIKSIHRAIVQFYIAIGHEVFYIRITKECEKNKWIQAQISKHNLKHIEIKFIENFFEGFYFDKAFENIDEYFESIKNSKILMSIEKLFKSPQVSLAYKKVFHQKLARFYYLNTIMSRLQDRYGEENIFFVPSNGINAYRTDGCEINDYRAFIKIKNLKHHKVTSVSFTFWSKAVSCFNVIRRAAHAILMALCLPIWIFTLAIKNTAVNLFNSKVSYKYAVMIISPSRQFANQVQKADYLIDGIRIKKEEVVFLSRDPLSKKHRKYFYDKGLACIDSPDKYISVRDLWRVIPAFVKIISQAFLNPVLMSATSFRLIYYHIRWHGFVRYVEVKNLISYCDFDIHSVARNIILKQRGVTTYFYLDSINFTGMFASNAAISRYRHNNFGFLYYDYFVSWSNSASKYFKDCKCEFNRYMDVGCFWSQHLRELSSNDASVGLERETILRKFPLGTKIVTVFDTTFHDDSITTYQDAIYFLQDILKLLDDFPDIFVILKEKKARKLHEKLSNQYTGMLDLYNALDRHPRCFLPGSNKNTSEIIALGDLVISFPFTSTTFEAVSARKKAIWHDPAGKYRNSFYESVPGLVSHNYDDLLKMVTALLSMPDKNYNDYLDMHVKGKIESYLDGKAIDRFKDLLTKY